MALISPAGRWLTVNRALCAMFGYEEHELLATDDQSLTHPDDLAADTEQSAQLLAGAIPALQAEKRYLHRDGRVIWTTVARAVERDAAGRPLHFVTHVQDIGERKRAEQKLNATAAELVRINGELEAFSYSVSHDLRAPLRAMQGFAQALLEDYAEQLDATGLEYARRVVDAAARMDGLIQDILAYSRLTTGHVRPEPLDLGALVEKVLRQRAAEIESRHAQVSVFGPLPRVIAQRTILAQALDNLVSNALKFVAPGVAPQVRIWAEPGPGRVRLWIEDKGIGIAPDHLGRVFRVFERLHGSDSYPGTGIGLAIVERAVERLGGAVGVESTPGVGSRFWLDLPAEDVA